MKDICFTFEFWKALKMKTFNGPSVTAYLLICKGHGGRWIQFQVTLAWYKVFFP